MIDRADPHMRETDAFSWYMERDPLLRSTVVAVLLFDRAPDHGRVLARLERASRIVPGLRHHLVEPPLRLAPPRWVVGRELRPLVACAPGGGTGAAGPGDRARSRAQGRNGGVRPGAAVVVLDHGGRPGRTGAPRRS